MNRFARKSLAGLLGAASMAAMIQCAPAAKEKYYEKVAPLPQEATLDERVDIASRTVPTANQLAWQDLELTAFLHFGINTFTDREWGDGKEDPALFNPEALDAEQWVKTLKDAGFKLVILTAKHHDGFCLWPTKTTDHSVANSPWKDGKGDVVRELRDACDKYGMKLGIYLSPWDRNSPKYGDSEAYNDQFVAQLTELLTNYGKIDEVWFDGACGEGPNGKQQVYDWPRFRQVMEQLQPEAVLAITGDDVRWVGNEGGVGRETEWSVTPLMPSIFPESKAYNDSLGINAMAKNIGDREMLANAKEVRWWPSEVDVSIRPGWFYHDSQQPKSLAHMADIYLSSVGRNSVLLLNIPPDRRGLIADADVARLKEFRQWIDANFTDNLVASADSASMSAALRPQSTVNAVVLSEDIRKGQRVEKFVVEALTDGAWKPVVEGTTIGNKRILMMDNDVVADSLRVNIQSTRNTPHVRPLKAYRVVMPNDLAARETEFNVVGKSTADGATLVCDAGRTAEIAGFIYSPAKGKDPVFKYVAEVSADGKTWKRMKTTGEFGNIFNNPIPQRVVFDKPVKGSMLRIVSVDDEPKATGKLEILTVK
ncbi:MAG: alpha-L-fucosidase [Paramuribaculum sp.]|nr:alpha-L-fucosidase [Paramuribaculum sp.]MDE5724370.1 alpha-L-fucosidase [Paramuribaculum sp.]